MKYLIASDIHGSLHFAQKLHSIIAQENPDKIILLGDLYYHGPRNPLPKDYNPMAVCKLLQSMQNKPLVIKGNCDAEVDETISNFLFHESASFDVGNKKAFASHGQKYNMDNFPETDFDIMLYGHFHTGFIETKNGKIFANPGSISLPKNGTENSYLLLEDNKITLKNLDQKIIKSFTF